MSKLKMKYFVLKPRGDSDYADAARLAMLKYAEVIEKCDEELAKDLKDWVFAETPQCRPPEVIPKGVMDELNSINIEDRGR